MTLKNVWLLHFLFWCVPKGLLAERHNYYSFRIPNVIALVPLIRANYLTGYIFLTNGEKMGSLTFYLEKI